MLVEGADDTLNFIAQKTEGWTGADLESLLNRVCLKSCSAIFFID